MKKIIAKLAIVATLFSSLVMPLATKAAPLADGLVGYWNMNDGVGITANEPVNNLDGTLTNGPLWSFSAPVLGSTAGVAFDGTDDYIEVADNTELDLTSAISVSGWIYVNSAAAEQGTVAAKWDDLGVDERGYLLAVHTDETPRFYVSHTGVDFPSAVGGALTDGWHHLVGSYDGTDIKLFVDGALVATTNSPGVINTNNDSLLIGANDGFGGLNRKYTTGSVDEVRIYNKALSATEVTRLNNYGSFTLDVTPESDINPVGTDHTVTITLDTPLSYIPVLYNVSGNVAPGEDTQYIYTDGNGQVVFTYTGVNAGVDTIIACMDVSWFVTGGGICNAPLWVNEPYDTAEKTWVNVYDILGMKYKDSNANGVKDGGEAGLENWTIFVDENDDGVLNNAISGSGVCNANAEEPCDLTDVNGNYTLENFVNGTYEVCEVLPANWVQTQPSSPSCYEVVVSGADITGQDFGNARLVSTTGKTKGFWGNKNGFAQMNDGNTVLTELAMLSLLNLRNEDGTDFDPASYSDFKSWLSKARAKNMAYMLSAQLSATVLDVEAGILSNSTLIYAPSLLPFAPAGLSLTGFISISDLIDAANVELGIHGIANETDAWWAYQNALRAILDAVNSQAVIAVEP